MKTPAINLPNAAHHRLTFHDTSGKSRALEVCGDGQVESSLLTTIPKESFLASLEDPRLQGADPFTALAQSGWQQDYSAGWSPNGFRMYLEGADGARQSLSVSNSSERGRLSSLSTTANGVEHSLAAQSREGRVIADSVKESVVLDASPAGLPVYQDGAILFDLPSAFTGGCTI